MKKIMTKLLNLPGIMVEDSIETSETIFLWVRAEKKRAICPRCGVISHRLHQNKRHNIRDLPISNREVILKVNRRQFKCEKCKKPFSETLDFLESRKRFTKRYAVRITEQVISSDVKNVAANNGLTDEEVWSMLMYVANKIKPIDVENLKKLGIDEIMKLV
jgi:transposase